MGFRKTVYRLLDEAQTEESRIMRTTLEKGRMRGQPVSIYYWSESVTETDARDMVQKMVRRT